MPSSVPSGLFWPRPLTANNSNVQFGASPALSAGTHRWAIIVRITKAGTLQRFGLRLHTAPGTASTVRFSFQNVQSGADGDADGTADQYRDGVSTGTTSSVWLQPADPLTDDGTNGGVKRTVSVGDLLACVVDITSYGSSSFTFSTVSLGNVPLIPLATPYGKYYNGSSWGAHYDKYFSPTLALEYNDGTFAMIPGAYPFLVTNVKGIGASSTPDEYGIKIVAPFSGTAAGLWWNGWGPWQNSEFVLYNSGGTQLSTTGSISLYTLPGGFYGPPGATLFLPFTATAAILEGSTYRLVEKPSHASDGMRLQYFDISAAAMRQALDGGESICATERTDAGSWTDTTTQVPWMGLWFTELSGGGGGGSYPFVG